MPRPCPTCQQTNADGERYCIYCSNPLPTANPRCCRNGHVVDPTWKECPYCKEVLPAAMDSSGSFPSPFATPEPPAYASKAGIPPPAPPPGLPPLPHPGETGASRSGRRETEFLSPAPPSRNGEVRPSGAPRNGRRIVGVLVTTSWNPDGDLFPVREGRNLIGRDPSCEICVPADRTLSGENSHITFRRSFVLGDLVSMGGTDLNGEPVEEQFRPLPNYSRIRTGATYWLFVALDQPEMGRPKSQTTPQLEGAGPPEGW